MNRIDYEAELEKAVQLYRSVEAMSEQEAQIAMNADDSKDVILACLQEEIDYWEGRVEAMREEQENENSPWWQHGLDPAFRCWKDVYSMFV